MKKIYKYHLSRDLRAFEKKDLLKHFKEILGFVSFYDNGLDFYLELIVSEEQEKLYYEINTIPLTPNGVSIYIEKPYEPGKKLELSHESINSDMLCFAILELIDYLYS